MMKLLAFTLLVTGILAGPLPQQQNENILELARRLGATTLVDLIDRAGLTGALSGPGPFTVVGPVNEAFTPERFPSEVLDFILGNMTALGEVLKYHVHAGTIRADDITNNMLVPSLQGNTVRLNKYNVGGFEVTTANGVPITSGDNEASNGIIHVGEFMMYPTIGDAVDMVVATESLSTLATALTVAELIPTLRGDGPFTIFAPTNEAFAKIDNLDEILADKELLTSILTYHVVPDARYSISLGGYQNLPTVNGATLKTIRLNDDDDLTVNGAKVETVDWSVSNGVIMLIDTVLLPTKDIPAKAEELGLTTLLSVLQRTGLDEALRGDGPFTVVGPVNEAFTADRFPSDVLDMILSNDTALTEVLKYHVHPGRILGEDITNNDLVDTLHGQKVRLNKYNNLGFEYVTANGAPIFNGDNVATNGIVQVSEFMMFPPGGDAVDIALGFDSLSTLVQALTIAELVDTLKAILLYHVVGDARYTISMNNNENIQTLNGKAVKVKENGAGGADLIINDAKAEIRDISATNAVIITIDTVLLPNKKIPAKAAELGLTTLVSLLERTGLDEALSADGPFTVIGPENEAFTTDRISSDVLDFILSNDTALAEVLKYHVTASEIRATDVTNNQLVPTLNGKTVRMNIYNNYGFPMITSNGVPLFSGDNEADNGLIQVGGYMMYPPAGTAVDNVLTRADLSTLVTALGVAELVPTLQGPGPFTILAPTNAAFAKVDNLDEILQDKELLTSILLYHVIGDARYSVSFNDADSVLTLEGNAVRVSRDVNANNQISFNNAKAETIDWSAENAVIYIIDEVLLPPSL